MGFYGLVRRIVTFSLNSRGRGADRDHHVNWPKTFKNKKIPRLRLNYVRTLSGRNTNVKICVFRRTTDVIS